MRNRRKGSQKVHKTEGSQGITVESSQGITMAIRPNRMGVNGLPEMVANEYNPNELLVDGTMRYLGPFTDGQVLDRTTVGAVRAGA